MALNDQMKCTLTRAEMKSTEGSELLVNESMCQDKISFIESPVSQPYSDAKQLMSDNSINKSVDVCAFPAVTVKTLSDLNATLEDDVVNYGLKILKNELSTEEIEAKSRQDNESEVWEPFVVKQTCSTCSEMAVSELNNLENGSLNFDDRQQGSDEEKVICISDREQRVAYETKVDNDKPKASSTDSAPPVLIAQIDIENGPYKLEYRRREENEKGKTVCGVGNEQTSVLKNSVDTERRKIFSINSASLLTVPWIGNKSVKPVTARPKTLAVTRLGIPNSLTDDNLAFKSKAYENKRDSLHEAYSKGLIAPFLDLAVLKRPPGLKWSPSFTFSDKKSSRAEELSTINKENKTKDSFIPLRRKRAQIRPRSANFFQATFHKSLIRSQSMEEVVKQLSEGAYLWKIRGVNKYYNRQYKVDKDSMSLVAESKKWWSPSGFTAGIANEGAENSVPIIDIAEIRDGWKTDTFNKVSDYNEKMKEKGTVVSSEPVIEEPLCFSIIHGSGGREVLDLMANSKEQRDMWISGLKFLLETVQSLHQDRLYDVWLRKKFEAADKDNNGSLNLDEVYTLVTSLNLKLDKKHARSLFNEANKSNLKRNSEEVLDAEEFVNFYHALLKMPEIESLYSRYVNQESKVMGAKELLDFLRTENGLMDFQSNQATQLIQQFEASNLKENDNLSFDGFYHLLLSDMFDIFNIEHQQSIFQDMTQPLAHYYISSSHNTYLIGHQLAGESSVEGYISALKRGCRLVELDLWDGDEGEPVIYHGHTFTSKITLADVLKDAIKLYAFTASSYPVILSIENHLSIEQQVVMVRLLKEILGDNLLTDLVPSDIKVLPSPEDLKYKIIVKAKKPQGVDIEDDDEDDDPDTIDYIDSDDGNAGTKKPKPHKPLTPELAQIVNVCEGKKFVSFTTSFESDKCIHFPSLRENKAKSLFESIPEDFVKFAERQIAKIYPLGTRTDSSNLKPYPFWSVGAQVVTLNMQTEDKANFYNEALFRRNGNCGYVLKPDILIGKKAYNPRNPSPDFMKVLRVKVISGQHLPPSEKKNDIVDPYIQLKVRGHPDDKQKQRTKIVKDNGFNPVWNEVLEVRIKVPEVALIYFNMRDESSLAKDPVLALACIPFASLCTGYRHVHLTDITGKSLSPAALFVHVSISRN